MTAASENAASASERAEAYLRLRAEAELRDALGFPRVKPPRRPNRRFASRSHFLRATARRRRNGFVAHASATYSAVSPGNSLVRLARSARGPLNQISTRLTMQLYGVRWRWRRWTGWSPRRRREDAQAPAEACLDRLEAVAAALTGAGAMNEVSARAVVSDLRVTLAARSLIDQDQMLDDRRDFRGGSAGAAPAAVGPVRCFPIGIAADCEIEGKPSRIFLSALILSPARATLDFTVTFPAEVLTHGPRVPHRMRFFDDATASDDRGTSYHCNFSGGGGPGRWEGRFDLTPVPAAAVRWLDLTVPGGNVVRLALDAPAPPVTATLTRLPPDERADRFLDSVTMRMLLYGTGVGDDHETSVEATTATVLLEAGIIGPNSPALGRFAAAAARSGVQMPPALADIAPRDLPAEWLGLTDRPDRGDRPCGVVPFAAVLPELDGARCILTGLRSDPERVTLQMHAQGWPEHSHRPHWQTAEAFQWTARDDLGGFYLTTEGSGSWGGGEADLELWLEPALNPQARALDVILTGPTGEVSVTVPLEWRESI